MLRYRNTLACGCKSGKVAFATAEIFPNASARRYTAVYLKSGLNKLTKNQCSSSDPERQSWASMLVALEINVVAGGKRS